MVELTVGLSMSASWAMMCQKCPWEDLDNTFLILIVRKNLKQERTMFAKSNQSITLKMSLFET